MAIAFVHGVPETSAIWAPMVEALAARGCADVILLVPPGFGVPLPSGFEPHRERYAEWLVGELEALDGNVHVVGHDWGAGHVFGLLDSRPDLVRSWAADCVGLMHPEYIWHEMAQVWQTPEAGEAAVADMIGMPQDDRVAGLRDAGLPAGTARALAEAQNDDMGRAILRLYRSGVQPAMAELGERLATAELPPGLVIVPSEDPYVGPVESSLERANVMGSPVCRLEGEGHWWMFGSAVPVVADALIAHWARA